MKRLLASIMLTAAATLLMISGVAVATDYPSIDNGYVGTAVCGECHTTQAADFAKSGHPYKYTHTGGATPPSSGVTTTLSGLFPRIKGVDIDTLSLGEDCGNGLVVCDGGTGDLAWSAINYTVGGFGWKIRWGIKDTLMTGGSTSTGFLWTSSVSSPSGAQYNMRDGSWSNYNGNKDKKYECAVCHNTNGIVSTSGYACATSAGTNGAPARTQPWANNPGMGPDSGTRGGYYSSWTFDGVQCEACHGPGEAHADAATPGASTVSMGTLSTVPGVDICAKCHIRAENAAGQSAECGGDLFSGNTASSPLNNGAKITDPFIGHHEQYNELAGLNNDGVHATVNCSQCHSPHKRTTTVVSEVVTALGITDNNQTAEQRGAVVSCVGCHASGNSGATKKVSGTRLAMGSIRCVDCHMAEATKSASASSTSGWGRKGDVKTHIFKINPTGSSIVRSNGYTNVAQNYITPKYSCGKCHDATMGLASGVSTAMTETQAKFFAKNMHRAGDISMATLNHSTSATDACVDCHTDAGVASGTVDIAATCGGCHDADGPGPLKTTAILTAMASGMHANNQAPVIGKGTVTTSGMTVSFTDASTDANGTTNTVKVNWGDGSVSTDVMGATFSHTYNRAKTYKIYHSVTDGTKSASDTFTATVPTTTSITGQVNTSAGAGISGAYVTLKQGGHTKKAVKTSASGAYTFSKVKAGSYDIKVYKYKQTFASPAATVTVGSSPVSAATITAQ